MDPATGVGRVVAVQPTARAGSSVLLKRVVNHLLTASKVECFGPTGKPCPEGKTGAHRVKITLTARACIANPEIAKPEGKREFCQQNCTDVGVKTDPAALPTLLGPGQSFTVEFTVNVPTLYPFEVRFNVLGDPVTLTLEQTPEDIAENTPLKPTHRMASNAQPGYRDVKYRVSIFPTNLTARVDAYGVIDGSIGGVTFSDGTNFKEGVSHGTVLTIVAAQGGVGKWFLDGVIYCSPGVKCTEAHVGEQVFAFKFVLRPQPNPWEGFDHGIPGPGGGDDGARARATTPGSHTAASEIEARTSLFGNSERVNLRSEAGFQKVSKAAVVTEPEGSFTGDVRAQAHVLWRIDWGGTVRGGRTSATLDKVEIEVGDQVKVKFAFNYQLESSMFSGQSRLQVGGRGREDDKFEGKSTADNGNEPHATFHDYNEPTRSIWSVPTTEEPIIATYVAITKKQLANGFARLTGTASDIRVLMRTTAPFEIVR
jgi:hypothetical protein